MEAAAAKDWISEENFDQIVRQYQKRVHRVIFLLVRDPDAADTLTQECFLRAYQSRASFRGDCQVGTWILRLAVNLAKDHGKNRRVWFWKKLVGLDEDTTGAAVQRLSSRQPTPENLLLLREELGAVWRAITSLSPQQRAIFLLRFVEDMSLAEVAQVLELRVGSVKAQLFRAVRKIRGKIKEEKWR